MSILKKILTKILAVTEVMQQSLKARCFDRTIRMGYREKEIKTLK
jgi:hypothetical protein